MLQHYNVVALPCRVRDPDRKGKVERGVGHAKNTTAERTTLRKPGGSSDLPVITGKRAGGHAHSTAPPSGRSPLCLPKRSPRCSRCPWSLSAYYQYGQRTVNLDGCVEVDAAYYGAPPGWIGRHVQVQWDSHQVRLMDPHTGQLLREHLRQARGRHRIKDEDRPKQTPLTTLQLLSRADRAGAQIGALCRGMHQKDGQTAVRRMPGRTVAG